MLHTEVTPHSELYLTDKVWFDGMWLEILKITTDNGILLSGGLWVCRTELQDGKRCIPDIEINIKRAKTLLLDNGYYVGKVNTGGYKI